MPGKPNGHGLQISKNEWIRWYAWQGSNLRPSVPEAYGIDRAYQASTPSSNKPFPLLMFSPGWTAPAWCHLSLGARLASHGFVVAVTTHYGEADWAFPWEPFDPLAVALYNRPRDVSFALTQLLAWNGAPGHILEGLIRPGEVAAAGWSLCGYAAMTLAAGDDSVSDLPLLWGEYAPPYTAAPTPPDPRIKAFVPLDGSDQCLWFTELARVKVPAMGIGEKWNMVLDWQARQHAAFSGRPSYRVDVYDSIHVSFNDFCATDYVFYEKGLITEENFEYYIGFDCTNIPPLEAHNLTYKYAIAFLKTHLSGEPGYQSLLTPGWALTNETAIEFFATEKKSPQSIKQDRPDLFVYFPHQPGSAQAQAEKDPKKAPPIWNAGRRK